MAAKKSGNTRRHFLGVTAAAAGRLAAAAAVVSSVIPARNAKAMGARWWKPRGGNNGGNGGNHGPQCFLRGTLIRTPGGDVAIEMLEIGQLVVTASGDRLPIKWIGRRNYKRGGESWPKTVVPVRIAADALADGVPGRDLLVSPGHSLLIDGVLIKAIDLVNGTTITQTAPAGSDSIDYLHIVLERHDAIMAEGAPVETLLLEPGIHENYTNGVEFVRLYPAEAASGMARFAPSVGYGGRLHLKALARAAFGEFVPTTAHAERIYRRILERTA